MYCSCTFLKKFLFNYLRMDQRDRRATEKQQRFQFKVNCLFSCNKTHMSQVGLCVLCRWSCTKHVRGNHPSFRIKVSCVCTKLTWSKCVQMCMWVCLYGSCSDRIHSKHLLKTLPRWTHMYAWECVWVYELYVKDISVITAGQCCWSHLHVLLSHIVQTSAIVLTFHLTPLISISSLIT